MFKPPAVQIGVGAPSFEEIVNVARHLAPVELTAEALAGIVETRGLVDALADDVHPHYGISTGFGALATLHIPRSKRVDLQRSLIRSHAAGALVIQVARLVSGI